MNDGLSILLQRLNVNTDLFLHVSAKSRLDHYIIVLIVIDETSKGTTCTAFAPLRMVPLQEHLPWVLKVADSYLWLHTQAIKAVMGPCEENEEQRRHGVHNR